MFLSRLGHHLANQVVRQQVHPDFFADHGRTVATQNVQLQEGLQRAQIEFDLPAIIPPKGDAYSRPRLALCRARRGLLRRCHVTWFFELWGWSVRRGWVGRAARGGTCAAELGALTPRHRPTAPNALLARAACGPAPSPP